MNEEKEINKSIKKGIRKKIIKDINKDKVNKILIKKKKKKYSIPDIKRINNIDIFLIEPEHSLNIGSIARAMGNFGFKNLFLVSPNIKDDKYYITAKHSKEIIKNMKEISYDDFLSIISSYDSIIGTSARIINDNNVHRMPITPKEFVKIYNPKTRYALLFGREGNGLNKREIEMCDLLISIPCSNEYRVLNISHALSIILYELTNSEFKGFFDYSDEKEKNILIDKLNQIIDKIRFKNDSKRRTIRFVVKHVIKNSNIRKKEIKSLYGFVKNIIKELEKQN